MNHDDTSDLIVESFESTDLSAVSNGQTDDHPVGKIRLMGEKLVGARTYALAGLMVTAIGLGVHGISHPTTSCA